MRWQTWTGGLLALWIAGCDCHVVLQARAYVGHLTPEQCAQRAQDPEPDASLICPGDEVTVCWASPTLDHTEIRLAPDPDGESGRSDGVWDSSVNLYHGIAYFQPDASTIITVAGSCATMTKLVHVVQDGEWTSIESEWTDSSCTLLTTFISTSYTSPRVQATAEQTSWQPMYTYTPSFVPSGSCGVPRPFLGTHHASAADDPHAACCGSAPSACCDEFYTDIVEPESMPTPMPLNPPFAGPHWFRGIWQHAYHPPVSCPVVCNQHERVPFQIRLRCALP